MESPDSSTFVVRPKAVAQRLVAVVASLVSISLVLNALKLLDAGVPDWLVDEFRLNNEENIPSFFSGLLFVAASALCALAWRSERAKKARASWSWAALSGVFAFLAFDELFAIHERLSDPIRKFFQLPDALRFAWVLGYLVFVLATVALFWPAWRGLEARFKKIFSAAAATYLLGAIVFETIGGAIYTGSPGDIWYGMAYTIEETLEMLGIVMFVYGLLLLLGGTGIVVVAQPGEEDTEPAHRDSVGDDALPEEAMSARSGRLPGDRGESSS